MSSPYEIKKLLNGQWLCLVPELESWTEKTRSRAIYRVMQAARLVHKDYIRAKEINFTVEPKPLVPVPEPPEFTEKELDLLRDIKKGKKIAFPINDYRFRHQVTEEEANMLLKIRKGLMMFVPTKGIDYHEEDLLARQKSTAGPSLATTFPEVAGC